VAAGRNSGVTQADSACGFGLWTFDFGLPTEGLMSWLYLFLAILCEVSGTTCMKLSHGFSRLVPSILLFVFYACSFTLMTITIKRLEISIVYAIWSGVGTALIAAIGILFFQESVSLLKIISTIFIIAGVIGLNLS
jgi:small multidrug resistance pump